ncbi:hypothetical protein CTA1_3965 [Colletotrichum tanaceti]|uniref:N-acetyltransferase domain-containing protein n=1 Tax=Colletotrichum tanaceti TaxID=1306861 RepID=A0A4U6XG45_9PEZI|nr:hypothetical protein CTA1_3965 [Colletotrichum tanaceti]
MAAFNGEQVTDAMMKDATRLFSENYGVWGDKGFGKPGSRVKMSPERLRAQCLPEGSKTAYVSITIDGVLAGNVFACRWEHAGRQVCWVTQLVVHSDYRERRLATTLLLTLIDDDDDAFGIMSSHPAACKALAKAVGDFRFSEPPLDFARDHAMRMLEASPISYIREAKVRGRLFHPDDTSGMVSAVDSNFYVDHGEPLEALAWFQQDGNWPLGELPDGHEFLFLVERPRRSRPRSAPSRRGHAVAAANETSEAAS